MADRPAVALDGDDQIAAAQILAWLAFPEHPDRGIRVMQNFVYRWQQARGAAKVKPLFDVYKTGILEKRLDTFEHQLRRRMTASEIMIGRIAANREGQISRAFGVGLNESIRRRIGGRDEQLGRLVRDYWTKSIPVIHLASSTRSAILAACERDAVKRFDLTRAVFKPDWVSQALEASEQQADWVSHFLPVERNRMIHFHRD